MAESAYPPIPPATFEFLVASFKLQAELHMGLLRYGDEADEHEPNLPVARHTIDLLAMLQEKTRGNLSMEEQRLLENTLTELRFRYVQAVSESRSQSKPPETDTPPGSSAAETEASAKE